VVFSHVVCNVSNSGMTCCWHVYALYTRVSYYTDVYVYMGTLRHIIESQNVSSWKGPMKIMDSNSLSLAGLLKTKPYD